MADEVMLDQNTAVEATTETTEIQPVESNGSWGIGKIFKVGAGILGAGVVAGIGVSIGDRIVTKVCDTIEVKQAGEEVLVEDDITKVEQKAKAEAEAKKNEIPTSEEGEKVLEETETAK